MPSTTETTGELFGIYKFDAGRLTIAYRFSGVRPDKFESAPGSGVTLVVLERPPQPPAASSQATAGAPPEVPVVHPIVRQVTHYRDYTGRLVAAQTAEVRSRVNGQLVKVLFQPGAMVKQGDPLLELDPRRSRPNRTNARRRSGWRNSGPNGRRPS